MQEPVFNELADLALKGSGQALTYSKAYLVQARLAHICRREGFGAPEDLIHCLKSRGNPVLAAETVAALTSKDTRFFRERERLNGALMSALQGPRASGRLRIWCAGGSTGQEAYSIAMQLEEMAELEPEAGAAKRAEILSTDLCRASTLKGQTGVYNHYEVQYGLSIQRLLKHFDKLPSGDWQVNEAVRARVAFRVHNLMESAAGLGQFDLIICRHVFAGMARNVRGRVADTLAQQLAPGGVILVGHDESLYGLTPRLESAGERLPNGWVAAGTANRNASAA